MRNLILFIFILNLIHVVGCSWFQPSNKNNPVCRALIDDMVFQPQTSNIRESEIQAGEILRERRDYDAVGCGD